MKEERRVLVIQFQLVKQLYQKDELIIWNRIENGTYYQRDGKESVQKGEVEPRQCRNRQGEFGDVPSQPVEEFVQALEQTVIGQLFSSTCSGSRDTKNQRRQTEVGHSHSK